MENGGEDSLRHIVSYHQVPVRGAEIASESRSPLPERPILVGQLSFSAKHCRQYDGPPVESIFRRDLEFFAGF